MLDPVVPFVTVVIDVFVVVIVVVILLSFLLFPKEVMAVHFSHCLMQSIGSTTTFA